MGFALSDIQLSSSVFQPHGGIPGKYTGEGEDVSPPLSWSNVPAGTQSFALFCHDPDAPLVTPGAYGFVHWVLYNIPADVTHLVEGEQKYTSGVNNFGNAGHGGPMPPVGHGTHQTERMPNLVGKNTEQCFSKSKTSKGKLKPNSERLPKPSMPGRRKA